MKLVENDRQKLIGLNFKVAIEDIMNGKVKKDQVEKILTETNDFKTAEHVKRTVQNLRGFWELSINRLQPQGGYGRKYIPVPPETVTEVLKEIDELAQEFFAAGKLVFIQPENFPLKTAHPYKKDEDWKNVTDRDDAPGFKIESPELEY